MFQLYLSSRLAVSLVSSLTVVVYVSKMAHVRPSLEWSCGVFFFLSCSICICLRMLLLFIIVLV